MSETDIKRIANGLRADVLRMVYNAGAGHVAGPLSIAEVVAELYFGGTVDFEKDKVILSCGHYVPIIYAALSRAGYISRAELGSFMQAGSRLPGHPERGVTPGIEVSSGPLGQGVSVATGIAMGMKMSGLDGRVYCILSDGEIQEGQVWEAFNFAVNKELSNLTFVLDRNGVQIEHYTKDIVSSENEVGRFEAFGLFTLSVDGNNPQAIKHSFETTRSARSAPKMIVMRTVAGKGVDFMENNPLWHDKTPNEEQLKKAIYQLEGKNV